MNMLRTVAIKLGILSLAEILKRTYDGKIQKVAVYQTKLRNEGLANVPYIIQQTIWT